VRDGKRPGFREDDDDDDEDEENVRGGETRNEKKSFAIDSSVYRNSTRYATSNGSKNPENGKEPRKNVCPDYGTESSGDEIDDSSSSSTENFNAAFDSLTNMNIKGLELQQQLQEDIMLCQQLYERRVGLKGVTAKDLSMLNQINDENVVSSNLLCY
jgi:hypothetical protein